MEKKGTHASPPIKKAARKPASPCILVIFGIAGDLTKRLLFPAICNLGSNGLLADNFFIVGVAKEPFNDESFRDYMKQNIPQFINEAEDRQFAEQLLAKIYYISGDFDDAKTYEILKNKLIDLHNTQHASTNYLFYFASPPEFMPDIAEHLSKADLLKETQNNFRRIVVEKPFGHDVASAKALNTLLLSSMKEEQIFRIDHFLGKETVQNLLAFRFSNGLFEPIWNRLYIDNVQITVAETLGVELRGSYYEKAGTLRDMIPNHLFQMMSLIAMEPPIDFSANYISDEKVKVLHAFQPLTPDRIIKQVVRGQYGPGEINGEHYVAYRDEKNVSPTSNIETYVALKLFIDNWRWWHVPFYLRTGKRMAVHQTEIVIQFRSGPSVLFTHNNTKKSSPIIAPNLLRIFIQPYEGISLQFNAKIPGPTMELGKVEMTFKYSDYFGIKPKTGYEMILYDCMNGDHLLFNKADLVETSWAIVQPILDAWREQAPTDFPNYAAGSWGPKSADELLAKNGHKWLL